MIHQIWNRHLLKWALVITVAVPVSQLFFVRELIAGLIIFTALFACVAGALLFLFLLGHATEAVFGWMKVCVRGVSHVLNRRVGNIDAVATNQFQNFSRIASQK
jgi:hypothetical protein